MDSQIPIFIISFNRLWSLKKVFANLSSLEDVKLIFIDNGSDYFETIDWLKERENEGYCVNWCSKVASVEDMYKKLANTIRDYIGTHPKTLFYGVNDSDVTIGSDPAQKIAKMIGFLETHQELNGVGPMMRFDDIPDYNHDKRVIVKRYTKFCKGPKEKHIFEDKSELTFIRAPLDTTFGIYRASFIKSGITLNAARIMGPWMAKHWDWYLNHEVPLPVDHLAYLVSKASRISHWSGTLDLKVPYVVSLGQRCHLAIWFKANNMTLQTLPFDHAISSMDGIIESIREADFTPPIKKLKVALPGQSKYKRLLSYSKNFVFLIMTWVIPLF